MFMWKKSLTATGPLLFACATSALPAAEKLDLERIKPVPANEPVPIADFFRQPLFWGPKLNPSGTHFAALVSPEKDRTALLVCDIAKGKINVIKGISNRDVYWFAWLTPNRLLFSLTNEKLYAEGLMVADLDSLGDNYAVELHNATSLVGVPKKSPLRPLVWIERNAYDDGKDDGVVQIDTTKKVRDDRNLFAGTPGDRNLADYGTIASIVRSYPKPPGDVAVEYRPDNNGELAFATTSTQGVFTLYRLAGKNWEKCPVDFDAIDPLTQGDQANELVVLGPREEGKPRALQLLDAATGKLGDVLFQDKAYDVSQLSFYRHPVTRGLLGIRFNRSRPSSVWFSESYRVVQKILDGYFPGQVVRIMGSDDEENRFFISVYSDRQPGTYYSLDLKTKALGLIKNSTPWIDPERMQPMSVLKFKTRDGHQLEGYVTLPAGASKQNPAPLVVLPHGGPGHRDTWGFDGEVQFLASRGYAVLQPNYRGSPGYNWMFPKGDRWEYRKMHDDVTDSVKTLMATGLVDPTRMAIMGTSFGGYLAMCGAAFEPGLYRCAIPIAGIFDWEQVMNEAKYDQFDNAAFGIFRRNLGDPSKNPAQFDAISPLRHIDQVKIPVLVAHGKEDKVASIAESRALIAQLEKYHVPHESLFVRGEGHGMQNVANQVELYGRIETFLAKNMTRVSAVPAARGTP